MKTAAFITIQVGLNCGSKLQTIATQQVLKKVGLDPICINYVPPRVTHRRYWKLSFQNPVRLIRRLLYFPVQLWSERIFDGYLAKYCNLSKKIYYKDDFPSVCPEADYYITGSDQVWNFKHNEGCDCHYFFDGIEGKKIAFSSSIGMTDLPLEYADYMKTKLGEYKAISVREKSAQDVLASWGLNSEHLIDPTIMLHGDEWLKFASRRLESSPYLFVYLPYNVSDIQMVYRTVRKIASARNLKVVSYSANVVGDKLSDRTVRFAGPGEFLSLMYYADHVVTNSFHGTAFSINLNKQFWAYMPSAFSTRLRSIVDLCGLECRLLEDEIADSRLDETIDYSKPNAILDSERTRALDFLRKAIS